MNCACIYEAHTRSKIFRASDPDSVITLSRTRERAWVCVQSISFGTTRSYTSTWNSSYQQHCCRSHWTAAERRRALERFSR